MTGVMTANRVQVIRRTDWLLVLGFAFAPMDGLRLLPKIGIAEVCLFLWSVIALFQYRLIPKLFARFWGLFIVTIVIGAILCQYIAPHESTVFPDVFIYVYLGLITIAMSSFMLKQTTGYMNCLVFTCCIVSCLVYLIIYMYTLTGATHLLSADLFFFSKFTGGAENPNKLAVFSCFAMFLSLFLFVSQSIKRVRTIGAVCVFLFIGLQTESSMFIVTTVCGLIICAYIVILANMKTKRRRVQCFAITVFVISLVMLVFHEAIFVTLIRWIALDDNGLSRFRLFASIRYTLEKSPIFGLGPGMHALDGQWSYHNAYLEVLALGGVVGLSLFAILMLRLFHAIGSRILLLIPLFPMLIYCTGSFAARNIEFWFIVCYLYAEGKHGRRT